MNQKPIFSTWAAELDYYALPVKEMKYSAYPVDEDVYLRTSRTYLVDEMIRMLKYLDRRCLYKEYSDIRNHS